MKYTIGIDLGGTTMTAGLVDEAYNGICFGNLPQAFCYNGSSSGCGLYCSCGQRL